MGESGWRPRVIMDAAKIAALRSQGLSWATIGEALGVGERTVRRSARASARNHSRIAFRIPLRINDLSAAFHPTKDRCFSTLAMRQATPVEGADAVI